MAGLLRAAIMASGVAAFLWTPAALAQSTDQTGATAEELQLLFQRQKSRGLKLAPNTAVAPVVPAETARAEPDPATQPAQTATAEPAADPVTDPAADPVATAAAEPAADPVTTGKAEPAATSVTVAQGTVTPAATADAPVPVAYTELDKADQINLRIGFDFDSAVLRDSEKAKLSAMCTAMKAVDVAVFRIIGHTDASGSDAYNEKLSLLRAEEVKRHLVSECGIEPARLQAVGVGKRYLYNTDDPRSEENRRVEFQALS